MKKIKSKSLVYIILILASITVLIPFLWGIANAFRSNEEIASLSGLSIHSFIPEHFTLGNFGRMFSAMDFTNILKNTAIICVLVTMGCLFINSMASYAFAKLRFPGKNLLFLLLLTTLILPIEVLIIPLYTTLKDLHMLDNMMTSLVVPFLANAFGIFFMRQFISSLPKELDESAAIDGCNNFGIFFKIVLPLTKPALITLGLIVFLQQWDSFIVPVTVINSDKQMVLQVALNYLQFGLYSDDWGVVFAGIVVSAIPIIVIFVFLQKYYVEGISSTGIKG
jgi:ABC-type glycerol-3-phosphate transport system permease component